MNERGERLRRTVSLALCLSLGSVAFTACARTTECNLAVSTKIDTTQVFNMSDRAIYVTVLPVYGVQSATVYADESRSVGEHIAQSERVTLSPENPEDVLVLPKSGDSVTARLENSDIVRFTC